MFHLNARVVHTHLYDVTHLPAYTGVSHDVVNDLNVNSASSSIDRTGLKTVHPEILDANGEVTNEELLTVRFSD